MSFNALVSGADCGPVNPLAQMMKNVEADRSLQKDRIGGAGPSGSQLQHLPSTSAQAPNAADMAMARQFFDGPSSAGPAMQHVAPFQLPGGMRQLGASPAPVLQQAPGPLHDHGASLNDTWTRGSATPPAALHESWNRSMSHTPVQQDQGPLAQPTMAQPSMAPSSMMSYQIPMGMGLAAMAQQRMLMGPSAGNAASMNSKQLDWDNEFARVEQDSKGKGKAVDSLEESFRQLSTEEKEKAAHEHPDYMSNLKRIWKNMDFKPDGETEDIAAWERDFQQVLQAQREEILGQIEAPDTDYTDDMRRSWEQRFGQGLNSDMESKTQPELDANGIPQLSEYPFEPQNPYLAQPAQDLLNNAKQYLANNGSLTEAALMLEAAIQKGELGEGGYEAWIILGETRSMDEREDIGLLALRQGVKNAKQGGHIGPGLLSLAVSYTNESFEAAAYENLREWLLSQYPSAKIPVPTPGGVALWHTRESITAGFIDVATTLHAAGKEDPDVQVGLGILYYSDAEYDKAKDCFEAALWSRPKDYLLWNRLGSCLSNGNKPEEALTVYREALRLRPTYTRAIFNVGVACLNIGAYKEAAEHFLGALASQKTLSNPLRSSDQLWKTLKKAFNMMDRDDLVNLAARGDVEVFRSQGFDF